MPNSETRYKLGPFVILTIIYFIVGFLTTINGQFQGPLQIAFLSQAEKLRNTLTTLITFFFFLGYLLNSGMGGRWVDRVGYKTTLLRALCIMVAGLLVYSLSAWISTTWPDAGRRIDTDWVPWAYFIFLAGCFLMGTSAAILQVAINPYVASYQLPGTTTLQRMNIATGVNSIGTTIGPFFVTGVIFAGVAMESVKPGQLLLPILAIAVFVAIVTFVTGKIRLPDLKGTRSAEKLPRSIWSFSHLSLGVLSIFLYVGAEVGVGVNINMYAMQMLEKGQALTFFGSTSLSIGTIHLGIPALLATLYWGGMMVGRLLSTMLPSVSPKSMLATMTAVAGLLVILAMLFENLYILAALGLFHSVMWSCIFTLAIAGLGAYTSKAAGVFMMGVFGGAIIPLFQGMLADAFGSWRWTWTLVLACEAAMFLYAIWGSRVRDPEARANLAAVPDDPGM